MLSIKIESKRYLTHRQHKINVNKYLSYIQHHHHYTLCINRSLCHSCYMSLPIKAQLLEGGDGVHSLLHPTHHAVW